MPSRVFRTVLGCEFASEGLSGLVMGGIWVKCGHWQDSLAFEEPKKTRSSYHSLLNVYAVLTRLEADLRVVPGGVLHEKQDNALKEERGNGK